MKLRDKPLGVIRVGNDESQQKKGISFVEIGALFWRSPQAKSSTIPLFFQILSHIVSRVNKVLDDNLTMVEPSEGSYDPSWDGFIRENVRCTTKSLKERKQ